ncbi:hypothetical protein ALC56_03273 [Trachymyrmex septentrionalis]|uniref:Trichohyalin-plectin-homology domain-containing protein n=1 Tax=Trachymyrmex septentrionalis TaxID=34720 RepID=A0A195FNK4_9HYME|nr:PREDICTED: trichohyalin-like [Trachymyrmex septentrionalis]KYN42135.1 hypothetical protein ALC56_03273 [Trachymyrmex septentrionalis]
MVWKRIYQPEVRTTYLLKPDQTLKNTKVSERTRALVIAKDTFQRFVDYTTEEDRIAAQQEKEAAKIAALKKATYEKSKTWDSTIENIKVRQREELLLKRQKAGEERKVFVKEMTEKKVAERAEVVQQARRLLQQKRPLCRQINRALLVSECLRELDAQVALQMTIRAMDEEQDEKYANSIKDIAKYEEQKNQEVEEQTKKTKAYRITLKKQIENNERDNKLKVMEELEAEKQDQINMTLDMQLTKKKEMQDILNKKKRLQQFFKETIEEKKRCGLELQHNEELKDRALEVYREAKDRIQKIEKSLALKKKEERARRLQIVEKQYVSPEEVRESKEREILEKAVEEKKAIEMEKQKAQKEREEKMHALMEEYKLHNTAMKTKQRLEEKELRAWEMMQRFKRDEYNEQIDLEERKRQWQQKLEYGNELQKDIEEKQMERDKEREKEAFEIEATKAAINKTNQRILLYSDEVLEESKGVRPLYPIVKAIENIKKEMGLAPKKKLEESIVKEEERPKRKYKARRRCNCPKPVAAAQIYYLQ